MRVLVTGSEGSLMQFVIRELLAAGHEVRGVDNFFRYGEIERKRDYELLRGDLCDPSIADSAVAGMDVVIQGAARIYGVLGFHKYPADILARDCELQQNLLWAAKNSGLQRFIYISSSMVYEKCTTVPSTEEDADNSPAPNTAYGLSKLVGERLCRAFQEQYGLPYTIFRPFNILTPLERADDEPGISHVFADFISAILARQRPFRILGDGEQVRCFTWIEDVAAPIAKYLAASETKNQTFNLGNPQAISMKELAEKIYKKAVARGIVPDDGPLEFEHHAVPADDVRVRIPSIRKSEQVLGWTPKVSLDQALEWCLDEAAAQSRD